MTKPIVGQTVYLRFPKNAGSRHLNGLYAEAQVTKVGRKYTYVTLTRTHEGLSFKEEYVFEEAKYRPGTYIEHGHDYGYRTRMYLDVATCTEYEQTRPTALVTINQFGQYGACSHFSTADLEAIAAIMQKYIK